MIVIMSVILCRIAKQNLLASHATSFDISDEIFIERNILLILCCFKWINAKRQTYALFTIFNNIDCEIRRGQFLS